MMPLLDSSLPLKQDIIYILARFVPEGMSSQSKKPSALGRSEAKPQGQRALPLGVYAGQAPQQ